MSGATAGVRMTPEPEASGCVVNGIDAVELCARCGDIGGNHGYGRCDFTGEAFQHHVPPQYRWRTLARTSGVGSGLPGSLTTLPQSSNVTPDPISQD